MMFCDFFKCLENITEFGWCLIKNFFRWMIFCRETLDFMTSKIMDMALIFVD